MRRYRRPTCHDCGGPVTREDIMRADDLCTPCYEIREEAARARRQAEGGGPPATVTGHIPPSMRGYFE